MGFTHGFKFDIIVNLKIKEECARTYIIDDLCKFRGIYAKTGERLFFQVDDG